ncbi:hypothetical protein [Kocuria tytonicola]|uniref:hypothetical protein n=1 Tax=Kocuria tytonicola TaxID=2055946 RepID=UPI00197DABFD|nr:hypothetical protein [Kocuria tytonicola]
MIAERPGRFPWRGKDPVMPFAATAALPGANPWAVSFLVQEHLVGLAHRYDDVAERLSGLASRCSDPAVGCTPWTGPGARAFRARLERHESDLREDVERCRDTAQSIRWAAGALGERIAAVESVAELGGPLLGVLGAVLGPVGILQGVVAPGGGTSANAPVPTGPAPSGAAGPPGGPSALGAPGPGAASRGSAGRLPSGATP